MPLPISVPREWDEGSDSLTLAPQRCFNPMTRSAASIWAIVGVLRRVLMPFGAMGNERSMQSTHGVLAIGHQFDVFRPNAVAVSATAGPNVIPHKTFGRLPDKEVMGRDGSTVQVESSIATYIATAQPQGTSICPAGIDLLPEPYFGRASAIVSNDEKPWAPTAIWADIRSATTSAMGKMGLHLGLNLLGVMRTAVRAARPLFCASILPERTC